MAKAPGADGWNAKGSKQGIDGSADTRKDTQTNRGPYGGTPKVTKATAHMEDMNYDGTVDKKEWQGNVKC